MFLIGSFLMSTIASISFQSDYLNGTMYEDESNISSRALERSKSFRTNLRIFENGQSLNQGHLLIFKKIAGNLQTLNQTMLASLAAKCCCYSSRQRKLKKLLLKQIEQNLDLRMIMRHHFDLKLI